MYFSSGLLRNLSFSLLKAVWEVHRGLCLTHSMASRQWVTAEQAQQLTAVPYMSSQAKGKWPTPSEGAI